MKRAMQSGFLNDGIIITKLNKSTAGKTEQWTLYFSVRYLGQ